MEAVIFVGGVSLGQKATAIPLAAIVGIVCGLVVGWIIYTFASRSGKLHVACTSLRKLTHLLLLPALRVFMIVMTNFLFLIGAGLFSKATSYFLINRFNRLSVHFHQAHCTSSTI